MARSDRSSSTKTAKKVTRRTPKRKPSASKGKSKRKKAGEKKTVVRHRKPDDLTLEDWQRALRREYGRQKDFSLENVGEHPFFSEFHVTSSDSGNTYRVAIRGDRPGDNFCSCPDFATNSLGTCKHVEFTLAKLERRKGAKKAFAQGFTPPYTEVFLQYGSRRTVRFRAGEECPRKLAQIAAEFFDDEGRLQPEAFAQFDRFLERASEVEHDLRCYDDVLRFVAEHRDADARRRLLDKAFPKGAESPKFEKLLSVPLYAYQREGALFAARAGRSLIGDEMGLGKTIQALAAAEIMAELFGVERVLIVCPTSLKHQCEREIERFTNRSVQVIGGRPEERAEQFAGDAFYKVMNYDTVHRDLEAIGKLAPDLVILDEAQRIKNWETRTANSVKKIDSPYCVVLTGTPLENRLEELVSIVQFVDRHRLGPTYRLLHDHQIRDGESGRVVGYQDLDHLGRTLEPILLRRQKSEVLDQLPERIDQNVFVPMTPQQREVHDGYRDTVAQIVNKWRRRGFLTEAEQRMLMVALQYMRMSCDSTYLCDRETDFGPKPDEVATLLDELFERPDTKVVLFSQWTRMHELLVRRIAERDWQHVLFHGGVPSKKRKSLVDRFREDAGCRAFLSTDAGGVGLNLQHANVVVNLDLPWNPAVLEQRIGRVHRLGQTRPVQVVNFVSQGTIEEQMLSVLSFKKSLFAGVLDGGESRVFLGGSKLNRFMEHVEKVTTGIESPAPADDDRGDATNETASKNGTPAPSNGEPDSFAGLLQGGLAVLEQLAAAARQESNGKGKKRSPSNGDGPVRTHRDPKTGQLYLQFPMPDPEIVDRTLSAVGDLLESWRSR